MKPLKTRLIERWRKSQPAIMERRLQEMADEAVEEFLSGENDFEIKWSHVIFFVAGSLLLIIGLVYLAANNI